MERSADSTAGRYGPQALTPLHRSPVEGASDSSNSTFLMSAQRRFFPTGVSETLVHMGWTVSIELCI